MYVNWEVVKKATIKKKGLKESKCEKCGKATITEEIPKKITHTNVDSRIEIEKRFGVLTYNYKKCTIVDRRTWGEPPIIKVIEDDGLHVTYYNKEGKKKIFSFSQPPIEDVIVSYTIKDNGKYVHTYIGSYTSD